MGEPIRFQPRYTFFFSSQRRYAFAQGNPYKNIDPTGHQLMMGQGPVSQADDDAVDNFPQRMFSIWVYHKLEKSGELSENKGKVGIYTDENGIHYLGYENKANQQSNKEGGHKQSTYGTYVPVEAQKEKQELCQRANIECGDDSKLKLKFDLIINQDKYISKIPEEKKEEKPKNTGGPSGSSGGSGPYGCSWWSECIVTYDSLASSTN